MGCKIIFSPQAIADLEGIVRYISKDDPITAERIGQALINRVVILENFPLLGSLYSKRPDVRKLVSRPYIIFYRAMPEIDRLEVLRYWHGARPDPRLS